MEGGYRDFGTMRLDLSGPLSRNMISVFQSSSLNVVSISPNASYAPPRQRRRDTRPDRGWSSSSARTDEGLWSFPLPHSGLYGESL